MPKAPDRTITRTDDPTGFHEKRRMISHPDRIVQKLPQSVDDKAFTLPGQGNACSYLPEYYEARSDIVAMAVLLERRWKSSYGSKAQIVHIIASAALGRNQPVARAQCSEDTGQRDRTKLYPPQAFDGGAPSSGRHSPYVPARTLRRA